jgi:low affinity Fe/Cu permease
MKSIPFGNDPIIFFQNILNKDTLPIQTNCSEHLRKLVFDMSNKDPTKRITLNQIQQLPIININSVQN